MSHRVNGYLVYMFFICSLSVCVCELFTNLLNFGLNFESAQEGIRFLWSEDFKIAKECVAVKSSLQYNWLSIIFCENIFPFVEAEGGYNLSSKALYLKEKYCL